MRYSRSLLPALALLATSLLPRDAVAQGGGGGGGGFQQGPSGPPADKRVLVVPGQRNGTSVFQLTNYPETRPLVEGQMDFKHYHTSAEIEWWMRKWAAEKADLVELYVVGKSFGDRDILQMTLTNKKTGAHTAKPAAFFEGGRHSGEISSTESVLYLAWHLIENYGKDPVITRLLDEKAVYLKPLNNPDGSDMYRLTAQSNRSTVRPYDDDRDGLFDEDPAEDLDGDGYIRQVRKFVGAGQGNFAVDTADTSGRLMRAVGQGRGDYTMSAEGIDNDGDGRINEDGVGGLDLHRNYTYNWRPMQEPTGRGYTQGGAGEYPLSEPETRAVFLWVTSHPNIGVANSMDTSVPMHLRGPSTCDDAECVFPSDLKLLLHFDSVGLAITKYPWAGNVYREYATRGNPQGQPQPLFGHGPDFGYFQMGVVWYGDEIWNGGRERDYDNDGDIDQYEVLRYCDEEFGGTCYKPWTKFTHPTLGEAESGGYNPKFFSQNGPPQSLDRWAGRQAMFNLELAKALPKLEITAVSVDALRSEPDSATHEVSVTVRNTGLLPTALEQAKRVKIVRPDRLQLVGGQARIVGPAVEFWMEGNETRTIRVRVRAPDATRAVTLRLLSTRGGEVTREVTLRR